MSVWQRVHLLNPEKPEAARSEPKDRTDGALTWPAASSGQFLSSSREEFSVFGAD